jgi:hypothetical protein
MSKASSTSLRGHGSDLVKELVLRVASPHLRKSSHARIERARGGWVVFV